MGHALACVRSLLVHYKLFVSLGRPRRQKDKQRFECGAKIRDCVLILNVFLGHFST